MWSHEVWPNIGYFEKGGRGVYPFCAQLKFSKKRRGGPALDVRKYVLVHFLGM